MDIWFSELVQYQYHCHLKQITCPRYATSSRGKGHISIKCHGTMTISWTYDPCICLRSHQHLGKKRTLYFMAPRTFLGNMILTSPNKNEIMLLIFYLASRLKRKKIHMEIITPTRKNKQHYTR